MSELFKGRLLAIRTKRNINQVNLATYCETSHESISAYENGKNFPSCEVLVKIADYLGTTTDYLLGRTNDDVSIYQLNKNEITDEEAELITYYKNLSVDNKLKLKGYIEAIKND
ncbi:MAG: helix-turn-helix transcriptional regulator [Bacilli bacterium]|nr:helix-turn-helix transcriptional regulator [Bacilli bacterium]